MLRPTTFRRRRCRPDARVAALTLSLVTAIPSASADPPEEVRVGSLGSSGILYEASPPGKFYHVLGATGDVNGDGFADFVLSYYDRGNSDRNRLLLVWGRRDLPRELPIDNLEGKASTIRSERLPRRVTPVGDLDGDGFDDFFILITGDDPPEWDRTRAGIAYLIYGQAQFPTEFSLLDPPAEVAIARFSSSKESKTSCCTSVSAEGDFDGDGVRDLVFGAGFADLPLGGPENGPGIIYGLSKLTMSM